MVTGSWLAWFWCSYDFFNKFGREMSVMFVIWSNHKCVATYLLSVCLLYFLVLRFPRVSPSHPMVYLKYFKILRLQHVGEIFVSFIPFNGINLLVPLSTQDTRSKRFQHHVSNASIRLFIGAWSFWLSMSMISLYK